MVSQKLQDNVDEICSEMIDNSPLVAVMWIVAYQIVQSGGSFAKPKCRKAWIDLMETIQYEERRVSDHNRYLPCRYCDQAFVPKIDESLLECFLEWYSTVSPDKLVALHKCQKCGGKIESIHVKTYEGDFHTPEPFSVSDDDEWQEILMSHTDL